MRVLSRRLISVLALFGGVLCTVETLPAQRPHAPPTRSLSGVLVELDGIEYLSSTEFAARYALQATWMQPEKKLALTKTGFRLELEVESREASINGLRVSLGAPLKLYRKTLYISRVDAERFLGPMINPVTGFSPRAPVRVIVLDAGHGGKDKGKINDRLGVNEKTFTLDVVLRLRKLLDAAGYKVVLTRSDDRFVELEDRPAVAGKVHADVFISVHFNSVETGAARVTGMEVFSLTPQTQFSTDDAQHEASDQARLFCPGNTNDNWNSRLAFELQRQLLGDLKMSDRGHKRQRFKVLRLALCPAILIEAGYLSNDSEARKISTVAYRQELANSIARGIEHYAATVRATEK